MSLLLSRANTSGIHPPGTATNPAIRLGGMTTGLFGGVGELGVSIAGTERFRFTDTGLTINTAGTQASPFLRMSGLSSGLFSPATHEFQFSHNNLAGVHFTSLGMGFGGGAPTANYPLNFRGNVAGLFELAVDNTNTAVGNRRGIGFHEGGVELARLRVVGAADASFPRGTTVLGPTVSTGNLLLIASAGGGITILPDGKVGLSTSPSAQLDVAGYIRSTSLDGLPTTGTGTELLYNTSTGSGVLQAYDRATSAFRPMIVDGSTLTLRTGGTSRLTLTSTGHIDSGNLIRITAQGTVPSTGTGLELFHTGAAGDGFIQSITRPASTYRPLHLRGDYIDFQTTTYLISLNTNGSLFWPSNGGTSYALQLANANTTHGFGYAFGWPTYSSSASKSDIRPLEEGESTPRLSHRRTKLKAPKRVHELQAGRLHGKGPRKNTLDGLMSLNPILYKGRGVGDAPSETDDIGFIAEEVAEIFPEFVTTNPDTGEVMGIMYDRFTVALLQGLKAAVRRIERLEGRK